MGKKERLMVYPFDIQFSPILRHKNILEKFEIIALVSPRGWGLNGKDAGQVDGGSGVNIRVSSDFEEKLSCCDTVLFAESHISIDFDKIIYPKIIKSIEKGKNIILMINTTADIEKSISEICEKHSVTFQSFNNISDLGVGIISQGVENILKINTPVIFVLGTGERAYKFDIQLSIREEIIKEGYKISQIGSRNYCEFLGFHSLPRFMYDNSLSVSNKIVLFNRFVKELEYKEKPDVIVIGIPGGVIPLNNDFTNRFGIMAFEISQAVIPDAAVFSTFFEDYDNEYFEKLSNLIKYKLGFEIDCYNLAAVKFDWERSKQSRLMSYITLDSEYIDVKKEKFKTLGTPVYNILNENDSYNMVSRLVDKLAGYAEAEYI